MIGGRADAVGAESPAIGVIGGSGLYELFDDRRVLDVPTPYGPTSAPVSIGSLGSRRVAFLPRHGTGHSVAPHRIDARPNLWALASLGVRAIVATAAVGSLRADAFPPDTFAVPDQLLDRTWGRAHTFFDRGAVRHLPFADPFDPVLRDLAIRAMPDAAPEATVVVIQGPRFSTRAEARMHRAMGADLVNMTLLPEAALAAELGIGFVALAYVADTDADEAAGSAEGVSADLVFARLAAAQPRLVEAIAAVVASVPADYTPRPLIDAASVAEVLAREPSG